ncbi:unnamed protein product [Schistosoma margrebowiei]|uniref:Uncharacterized protein n=1 Tax=Schistosoma margrebowiei TaxID=48269 RepID=A0A183MRT9_9TREM|nr:unnamed protein product [Schistosoma margrebowiei]
MRTLSPVSTRIQHRQVALPRELSTCSHVFIRVDSVRKPLQQPYEGPFRMIARHEKTFKVDRHGRVEFVSIDRLKPAHVDDSAPSNNLRFNARPIKPSGMVKSFSDPTLDTPETSFSRLSQQHASSAPSRDETTPTPSTISVWFRRLQSTLAKAGLATHALVNVLSRYIGLNVWHTLGLELGRCGRFWFFGSTWFRPTSAAFLVRIPYERHPQILDTNHSCSMSTQATSTAHRSWYRSPKITFVGDSTINDRFPVFQSVRPTNARQPISPTI